MKNRNKGPRNQDEKGNKNDARREVNHKTKHERHKEHEEIINREVPKKKTGRTRVKKSEPVK